MKNKLLLLFVILISSTLVNAQKVGLVLSGGGALGYAHIGVLRALEENNIPIDYITGTSAGALVGSMYASGWSPELMDSLVNSDKFKLMSVGGIEKKHDHFYRVDKPDASWVNFKLTKDFALTKIIPTNFTNPVLLDFESMLNYSPVGTAVNYDFDSLFVPFRCVASDVQGKVPVVFKEGHLNQAVRASMTYPGFLKPIMVNGRLMFDGGLYNNFPTDIMYNDFYPDIIIGVNFSDSAKAPDQDDIVSQFKTMIINRQPFSMMCENGIMIEPEEPISLFGFDECDKAIQAGYNATILMMDSIKLLISRRVEKSEVMLRRKAFVSQFRPLLFESVEVHGVSDHVDKYIARVLMRGDSLVGKEVLKKRYFWLVSDQKLKFIYPLAELNPETGNYKLRLDVYPEKPFSIRLGGAISSRPINTGYLGLQYSRLGKVGVHVSAESYFGKYYGSGRVGGELDFNYRVPFTVGVEGIISRWDYFRSFATFFEDSRPSFIVESEQFGGLTLSTPVSYFGKLTLGYDFGRIDDNYYQSDNFTSSDTSDATALTGNVLRLEYLQNSLNRKIYANEGILINLEAKYFVGTENSYPGSTSFLTIPSENIQHNILLLKGEVQKYFRFRDKISLGFNATGVGFITPEFMDNYTATFVVSPIFQPIPYMITLLDDAYSDHFYATLGSQLTYSFTDNLELRTEVYLYQPIFELSANSFNIPFYNYDYVKPKLISSSKLVLNTPLGPLAASVNYLGALDLPWSFDLTFGYIIHNRRFFK
jgi:NTE family protein